MSAEGVDDPRCPNCRCMALFRPLGGGRFFCVGCGEEFELLTGAVALTRARDGCGTCRSVRVLLDGEHEVATIPYGQRRVVHLPAGVHSLSLKMDWGRSPEYRVEVRPGDRLELEGPLRWQGFLWWCNIYAGFIAPGRVFVIRPLPEGTPKSSWRLLGDRVCEFAGYFGFHGLCFLLVVLLLSWVAG